MALDNLHRSFGEALIADDRRYFEAGASRFETAAFEVFWLPALRLAAAGCVAYPKDLGGNSIGTLDQALDELETALLHRGIGHARFYECAFSEAWRARLRHRGYEEAIEIALAVEPASALCPRIDEQSLRSLRTVRSDEDWNLKLQLHEHLGAFPDGHAYPSARWISLERAKVDAGYMEMAMVVRDGVPLGAVGVARHGSLLRLKNLFVSPVARGLGYGEWLTQYCIWRALECGSEVFGCFGIEGRDGDRLYRRCGLRPVGRQVGWSLPLTQRYDLEQRLGDLEGVS